MKTKLFVGLMMALISLSLVVLAQTSKMASVYTDLSTKACKTLEQSDEGTGWYRGECAGIASYKLQVTEGDIRQSVDVITPKKKKFELDFTGKVSGGFSSLGEKAEWRVSGSGKTMKPKALIVRFNASENPEDSSKITSYLVVSKITDKQICVTDVVKPGANANEEARKLADESANKPCKE